MTPRQVNEKNPLLPLRKEIDEIDEALIELLARRLRLSTEIGQVKHLRGLAIQNSNREQQILSRIEASPFDKCTKQSIASIYQEIFATSRDVQNRDSIVDEAADSSDS